MAEFLLEVRAEEIPARMVADASRRLASSFFETLVTRGLPPDSVESHYTVRRLIVCLRGLLEREPDREQEVFGPPATAAFDADGKPTQALVGFARRCGVEPEEVERRQTPKGEYAAVTTVTAGQPMVQILAEITPRLITEMEWPKPMLWGTSLGPWVRPVKGIVALLDGDVVPFEVFGINAGDTTVGHPILSPEPITVSGWKQYRGALAQRAIEIDAGERRGALERGFARVAEKLGGEVASDDALLERLVAMVEIPGIVAGECDPEDIPGEVLTASLRDHQNAFGLKADGRPLPAFVTVMDRPDDPEGLVRQGNEWVVAARLEDARFFVAEDRKRTLEQRRPDLARLTFHRELGSYADKTERLMEYGEFLCRLCERDDLVVPIQTAASLAKVDLTCEVVKEFTGLQGVIGGIYAAEQGLDDEVSRAIYQQYQPASSGDPIPDGLLAQLLGIADRMVTLGGFFALDEIPSGSRDPYALRRAAQGVVEILIGAGLELDLQRLTEQAVGQHADLVDGDNEGAIDGLSRFLRDRVASLLGRRGFAYDEVAAAVAVDDLPVAALARVEALHAARKNDGFVEVADAAKRIRNILSGQQPAKLVSEERLQQVQERELWQAVQASEEVVSTTTSQRDYASALDHVAGYAPLLESFFDHVLVMDEDAEMRANRLALLQAVDRLFVRVGDLSQLAVERRAAREQEQDGG